MYFSKTEMHTHICCRPIKNGRFWDLASNSSGPPFLPPCTAPSLQDVKQWPEHSSKAFQRNAANIQILTLTKTPNPLFAHNLIGPLEMLELLELATRLGKGFFGQKASDACIESGIECWCIQCTSLCLCLLGGSAFQLAKKLSGFFTKLRGFPHLEVKPPPHLGGFK